MKTNTKNQRNNNSRNSLTIFSSLFFFSLMFALLACEQPFRAGLGIVVDIRPPTISLTAPGAGDPISGTARRFYGVAEDDYRIDYVEYQITNVSIDDTDIYNPAEGERREYLRSLSNWNRASLDMIKQNVTNWYFDIDTTKFDDGDLKMRLRVFDSEGKKAETGEIVFMIRNNLPVIIVTNPSVLPSDDYRVPPYLDYDDYIEKNKGTLGGGGRLNYGTFQTLPEPVNYPRKMDMGSFISGSISFDQDIYLGPETEVFYPPQIRLWPISDDPGEGEYLTGQWPSYEDVPWENFPYNTGNESDDRLFFVSNGSYLFTWDLPEAGRFYGFEVRAISAASTEDNVVRFRYPRDTWPIRTGFTMEEWDSLWDDPRQWGPGTNVNFYAENSHVLIYVKEQNTLPVVGMYRLENLDDWDAVAQEYNPIMRNSVPLDDTVYHEFVNRQTVNKNGPFTLRMWASHTDGILSAEAYWEKEGTKERGRLIWDPAPGESITKPYYEWGYPDLHMGGGLRRNFIFTYNDNITLDKIPGGAHALVAGKSKVHAFSGSDQEWEEGKKRGEWPALGTLGGGWSELDRLSDGTYNIEVYARSTHNRNGEITYAPHTNTVRIDRIAPEVEILTIDGAYTLSLTSNPPVTEVNGVIQPRLRFSEDGTGLRTATDDYYKRSNNLYGYDQRYILVGENDTAAMNALTAWPGIPDTTTGFDTTVIPGVTVYKHGPIFDSMFKFKTSPLYTGYTGGTPPAENAGGEERALTDGTYWLYVFARDNAFNMGRLAAPLKVVVDKNTDKPGIDFLGAVDATVTNPSEIADLTDAGFIYKDSADRIQYRNQLGPSSSLRLRLRDDDSLDLGINDTGAANVSKVSISFTAASCAQTNEKEVITPLTGNYVINFTDADIKSIFTPQSVVSGGVRQAVRTREGTISQTFLLDKLKSPGTGYDAYGLFAPKGGPAAYNSLPDGIYRMIVSIEDYAPAKLSISDSFLPVVAKADITIWIYVDTTNPDITIYEGVGANNSTPQGWISPANGLSGLTASPYNVTFQTSKRDGVYIRGTLSDRNGSVKVKTFTITNELEQRPGISIEGRGTFAWEDLVYADEREVKIIRVTNTKQFEATFTAPVHIDPDVSDKFVVTLQMEDRFGRTSAIIKRNFQIDKVAPEVDTRNPIPTFTRRDNKRMPGSDPGATGDKFTRLANGIVSFDVTASDNFKVTEIRYWLIKSGASFSGWNQGSLTPGATVATTANGKWGSLTANFTQPIYIDTTKLDDVEYDLYIMARDEAGNVSDSNGTVLTGYSYPAAGKTARRQTIYVQQPEDAPHFSQNSLQGVVGGQNMIARLTINDDDGFSNGDGGIRSGTLRIWMSKTATNENTGTLGVNAIPNYTGPVSLDAGTLMGKNISLTLDLSTITEFSDVLQGSGRKQYIIEATDSWSGKVIDEAGTKATGSNGTGTMVPRREYFWFVLDNQAPIVTITEPAPGTTFGLDTTNFLVKGSISDAYLKKDASDNYIIGLQLDGESKYVTSPTANSSLTPFVLGKGVYNTPAGSNMTSYIKQITSDIPAAGDTTVRFEIPANALIPSYSTLPSGPHPMVFMAEDESGQTGSFSLNFTKDMDPPELAFTTGITKNTTVPLPDIGSPSASWWSAAKNNTNYLAKRAVSLPVITYTNDGKNFPVITGTFTDKLSNIDTATFFIKWDDEAAYKPILNELEGDGKSVRWTVYLTKDGTSVNAGTSTNPILSDGVHSIQLKIKDTAGNELVDPKMYGFRLNSREPKSTITALPQTVYGDRSRPTAETVFTISGTGTSRNLSDVRVKIRYTGPDTGNFAGYERSVLVNPVDAIVTANNWTFISDSVAAPMEDLQETLSWTLAVPREYIQRAGNITVANANLMRAGNYEVVVTAIDRSSKSSEEETHVNIWPFVVDSAAPTFNFTNPRLESGLTGTPAITTAPNRAPNYWTQNSTNLAARNVLSSDTPNIRGRVSDTNNLDAVEVQLARWNYTTGTSGTWEYYNFTGNNWTGGALDNENSWAAVLVPVGSPTPVKPESPEFVLDWAFIGVDGDPNTAGVQPLPDGYYSVRLRARDTARVNASPPPSPLPDLDWAGTNGGNPAYSHFVYFFIDRTPPSVANADSSTTFSSRYITASTNPTRPQYGLEFKVTASDANRFEKMEVAVERVNGTGGNLPGNVTLLFPTPAANTAGTWTDKGGGVYTASVMMAFIPREVIGSTGHATNGLPDGAYKVAFTATDLAGKTYRETRTITLDNRPPTGKIDEPMFGGEITRHNAEGNETSPRTVIHRFASASDVKIGGDAFTVAGSTDDLGDNGSASGPAGIWYRIGYGTQGKDSLPNVSGMTATARSQAIMAWATGTNNGSGVTITSTNGDTGAAFNKTFDDAAKGTASSLWFKYEKTGTPVTEVYPDDTTSANTYDSPTGFGGRTAIDLYKWALDATTTGAASVATSYAVGGVTIRTRTYARTADGAAYGSGASAQYLARIINENELPLGMRRGGLYSLPLVIRVVDNAGNVFYELRDIWLYPNGDNPSSVIINPALRFTGYTGGDTARGGQMQIQGIASDNKSVRTVIYRVKVDGGTNTAQGTAPTNDNILVKTDGSYPANPPGGGGIVAIPGATRWEDHREYGTATTGMLGKWNSYSSVNGANNGLNVRGETGTAALSKTGWYVANLESQSYAPTMPWDFMLNTGGEINELIAAYGFIGSGSAVKNMIRVWVEVLVFDGLEPNASAAYNRMSLGTEDPNADYPRPYVREFYYTTSAPSVTAHQISNLGSTTAFSNYTSPLASDNVRSGNFALRATLNGNSNNIGQISVRLRGETNSDWRPVFVSGSTTALPNGVGLSWTTANRVATLTYTFDSTRASSTSALQSVRAGAWAASGGTFTVDVRVRDTSNPPAEAVYTFEVGVDNYVPVADQVRTVTPKKVAGSSVSFLGRVFDYQGIPSSPQPDHKGIKEVHVWFMTRATSATPYINMSTGARANAATAGANGATTGIYTTPGADVAYNGDAVTSVTKTANPNPPTASRNIPTTANFVKVLRLGEQGITWSPTNDWDIFWSFNLDTTNFPDGWMTMHYVVTDHANNRSYYTQEMVVMNNSPRISNVTLYTNNTGEGAVFTTHEGNDAYSDYVIPETPYTNGYLDSGFISKNMVIGFGVDTIGGNEPLNYQVRYVERYRVPLTNSNLRAMAKRATLSTRNPDGTFTFTPGGTASATDYLRYYNDSGTLVQNESVNNFINMYTIATGSGANLSAGVWRILGVPSPTPADGSHFVFQGIEVTTPTDPLYGVENNVVPMAFDDVYVYAYKEVQNKPAVPRTGANANTIAPADMNFDGSGYFSTSDNTKINEARGTSAANATASNNAGTAYFLIKVWDTVDANETRAQTGFTEKDMLYDAIVIGMRVYLTDITNPVARLYDLNPYMETAVIGNNIGTNNQKLTRDEAAAPVEIGANIKRGGLYNLGTERAPIKSGYIDPRGASTVLYPYVNYPSDPANPYVGARRERPDGYVDGDALTGALADKVSGSILLRGLAWDDQLIDTISIKIGSDSEKPILKLEYEYPNGNIWTDTTAPTPAEIAANSLTRKIVPIEYVRPNGTTWSTGTAPNIRYIPNTAEIAADDLTRKMNAWAYEEISWKTGHTVEWAYLWNTEAEPSGRTRGGPAAAAQIDVTVKDLKASRTNGVVTTTQETANPSTTFHNRVSVDIVPYITGFRRKLPEFATKRSRQGWYSFFRDETNIRVLGYNLGTSINTTTGTIIQLYDGANTRTLTREDYAENTNMPNDGHIFNITDGTTNTMNSGRIDVFVGSTATANRAWNHQSSNTNRSWNAEYSDYTSGSDLWTNKPYAHIWRTNEAVGTTTVGGTYFGSSSADTASMENPAMALEYGTTGGTPGRLHGVWGVKSTFGVYYGTNNGNISGTTRGRNRLQDANDPLLLPDIDYYPGADNATNRTAIAVYEWDGLPGMILTTTMEERAVYTGGDIIRPSIFVTTRSTTVASSDRWQNPRVRMAAPNNNATTGSGMVENAPRGDAGRLYVSTYDSVNKSLHYVTRAGTTNSPGNTSGNTPTGLVLDGGASAGVVNNDAWGAVGAGSGSTTTSTSTRAGNWSALDYVTDGGSDGETTVPVIAYFDETNQTLRLAYGASTTSTNATSWTRRNVLSTGDPLFKGSGKYVSMKVDKDNNIHLAFLNSNQNAMVYAKGTRTGNFEAVIVDNVVTGGTWTDISVDNNGNPWIVYGDNGRTGNYDGVRIAYFDSAFTRPLTDTVSGKAITGWEALTMPANYTISDDRLNIEAWPPTDRRPPPATGTNPALAAASPNGAWHAAVGYSGTGGASNARMFRIGYFFKPTNSLLSGL